jgi:hypothetical protein
VPREEREDERERKKGPHYELRRSEMFIATGNVYANTRSAPLGAASSGVFVLAINVIDRSRSYGAGTFFRFARYKDLAPTEPGLALAEPGIVCIRGKVRSTLPTESASQARQRSTVVHKALDLD